MVNRLWKFLKWSIHCLTILQPRSTVPHPSQAWPWTRSDFSLNSIMAFLLCRAQQDRACPQSFCPRSTQAMVVFALSRVPPWFRQGSLYQKRVISYYCICYKAMDGVELVQLLFAFYILHSPHCLSSVMKLFGNLYLKQAVTGGRLICKHQHRASEPINGQ